MSALKNFYHDELERRRAIEDGEDVCAECSSELAEVEGLCSDCWSMVNGALGVGA